MAPYYDIVSHCFSCNGDFFDPEVNGIDEVVEAYINCVKKIKFHGPTIFNEVIKVAAE